MKAAVYHGPPGSWPEKPIAIEKVPRPTPGPKDVLVKVAACGICHTDLTYLHGAPIPKGPPIVLGHEPSGIVAEVGFGVPAEGFVVAHIAVAALVVEVVDKRPVLVALARELDKKFHLLT